MDNSKLEKVIYSFAMGYFDNKLSEITDNFYDIAVNVYDNQYGKQCQITILMKKPFSGNESDAMHDIIREVKSAVNRFFPSVKGNVSNSVSTIESYEKTKWWYEKNKSIMKYNVD
jgi:hypothetical protein